MEKILSKVRSIYLVGIGGIGMSGLALLLKSRGFKVKGSDLVDNCNVRKLREEGIEVSIGHKEENIDGDIDALTYSSAVKDDNPEVIQAQRRSIPILKRGELLAFLCKDKKTIAVSGSHGKTTTTSLLSYLLTSLGYQPGVFIGGIPLNYSSHAWWGEDYFVVETDESDGSFLSCPWWTSIITNIDCEHLDYHGSIDNLRNNFLKLALETKEKVFGWGDDSYIREILSKVKGWSFGWGENNLIRGRNFNFNGKFSCMDVYFDKKFITRLKIPLLGEHNCLNILAALSFLLYIGEDLNKVKGLIEEFKGTKRRFQIKDKVKDVIFIDDYAHHPTEIQAVLKTARSLQHKRLLVIFEPHRFSRLKALYDKFPKALSLADRIVITDIYSASEKEIENITAQGLAKDIDKQYPGKARYIPKDKLKSELPGCLKKGDLCLGLGAGDISLILDEIIKKFKLQS